MGRYAQAKRRGGSSTAAPSIGPPPAPTYEFDGPDLIQVAQGLPDVGGNSSVYSSDSESGPWELYDSLGWAARVNWGLPSALPAAWLAFTENGNGMTYIGESARSELLDNR